MNENKPSIPPDIKPIGNVDASQEHPLVFSDPRGYTGNIYSEADIIKLINRQIDQSASYMEIAKEADDELRLAEKEIHELENKVEELGSANEMWQKFSEVQKKQVKYRVNELFDIGVELDDLQKKLKKSKELAQWVQSKIFSSSGRMFESDEELHKIQALVIKVGEYNKDPEIKREPANHSKPGQRGYDDGQGTG